MSPEAFVATLLTQARSFKLCIAANSCQNFSDDFPDTKGELRDPAPHARWHRHCISRPRFPTLTPNEDDDDANT